MYPMKRSNRTFRCISVAVVAFVASGALVGAVITGGAPSAFGSGITSAVDYPTPYGQPWGTAFDGAGRVWVAMPGCDPSPSCSSSTPPGKLALFDPNTSKWTTVVSLPAGYGQPLFVQVDRAGKVWFTMPVTNSIGVYDPAATTVRQWPIPTAAAGPWDLALDSNGKIWFTEHFVNKIGSFNPVSLTFQEISTPATNSDPYGIAVDTANNIWFTENTDSVALIGEYTNSGVLKEYRIKNGPTAGSGLTPHLIIVAPDGHVWWSEGWVHAVGRINPYTAVPGTNDSVVEFRYSPSCSSCGSHTSGIGVDSNGLIWLDDSLQNTFGSLQVSGRIFTFYPSPSGGHPHDGLNVDSQNRIWFDEEFANKLAKVIQSTSTSTTTTSPSTTSTSTSTSTSTTSTSTSTTTSSSTSTSTSTSTTTTTTTVPTSGVLGTDTFQRPDQSLWGTASDGQTWGGDANSFSLFSISGGKGLVTNTGSASYSAVLGPTAANAEAFATGSLSSFTNSNFGDVLRWTDGNNWYKAYIDGGNLIIQKKVSGTATILASKPFAATAGTSYTVHFRAVGTTLAVNAWATSGTEPSSWMLTATDATLASGRAGLRFLTQTGTATMTSFRAGSL
jgi:streptogramin lyase